MDHEQETQLNSFVVQAFNNILAWEEHALSDACDRKLSVKELHVLEAVSDLTARAGNTMTSVAERLSIQVSSLTTAVNTLVRKGYLRRENAPEDRRIIRIFLTEAGEKANQLHSKFHDHMIRAATDELNEEELSVLTRALNRLRRFFSDAARKGDSDLSQRKEPTTWPFRF